MTIEDIEITVLVILTLKIVEISKTDLQTIYFIIFSMNPMVDVGQVEGAFVMGLGYWLTEQVKFDPQSGRLLTDSTWVSYKNTAIHVPFL